jgi:hypothetical protein
VYDRVELMVNIVEYVARLSEPGGLVPRDPVERSRFVAEIAAKYLKPKDGWSESQLRQWEEEKAELVGEMGMAALSIINEQDTKLVN